MGFKRTSEGRVFFTGNKDTANDRHDSFTSEPKKSLPNQTEILVLLKTLNERLKITQAERNKMRQTLESYGSLIGSLDERTQEAESAMAALKTMQQEQSQNMSKRASGYAQITKRLKLTEEKVDKAIEDRARFMRKIERIEETVLQTRDAIQGQSNRASHWGAFFVCASSF